MNLHLLLIDPQRDFCEPAGNGGGALFVPGAVEDMANVAAMITTHSSKLDDIHVTLDSHHPLHIAHPVWWEDSSGKHPNPFTIITVKDVEDGTWRASNLSLQRYSMKYVQKLQNSGRYALCIWPPHCLIGSSGHAVDPGVFQALTNWANDNFGVVNFCTKGSNIKTEHYSAIKAEVPIDNDPSTQLNIEFVKAMMDATHILIAGEALTHCVLNTVTDTADAFGDDSYVQKLVLLRDCTSMIPGFETQAQTWIETMKKRGMQVSDSKSFFA